jgi:hypothetical protein
MSHVHSWVWDGIGGRCECGADITNEEAVMGARRIGPGVYQVMNEPDAFIAEHLAMRADYETTPTYLALQAEIERLRKDNADLTIRFGNDLLVEIDRLKAESERLKALLRSVVEYAGVEGLETDEINRINAALTDSPTGAPAEKTIPGSLNQTSGCSTPPSASASYREF